MMAAKLFARSRMSRSDAVIPSIPWISRLIISALSRVRTV